MSICAEPTGIATSSAATNTSSKVKPRDVRLLIVKPRLATKMIRRQRVGMRHCAQLKTPLVTYDSDGEILSRTGADVAARVCYRAGDGVAVSGGIGQQRPRVFVPRACGKRNACNA